MRAYETHRFAQDEHDILISNHARIGEKEKSKGQVEKRHASDDGESAYETHNEQQLEYMDVM